MNIEWQIEWEQFYNKFITYDGYKSVLNGLWVTIQIAVLGLLIGIVIGTLIALIKMVPKYGLTPKVLSKICDVYILLIVLFSAKFSSWGSRSLLREGIEVFIRWVSKFASTFRHLTLTFLLSLSKTNSAEIYPASQSDLIQVEIVLLLTE